MKITVGDAVAAQRGVVSGVKNPLWWGYRERLSTLLCAVAEPRHIIGKYGGISQGVMSKSETGRAVPRIGSVERQALALGVSPTWLAFGDQGRLRFRQRRSRPVVPHDPPAPQPGPVNGPLLSEQVGARLKHARSVCGLTLRALGELAGFSHTGAQAIERGVEPRLSVVEQLAVALDVAPGWLAFGDGEGPELAEALEPHAGPGR